MFSMTTSLVLVIDDNPADIELFETAWAPVGRHHSIDIHACTSCNEAVRWLRDGVPPGHAVVGALVDLMLFDAAGHAAVDIISALPLLNGVPVISWSGIDIGATQTDRIRKSATRVWTKPHNWTAWSAFVRRFSDLLNRQSAPARSCHSALI
jgi:CheY-like chemotaxis protein